FPIAKLFWLAAFSGGLIVGAAAPAAAHTRMDMPPARDMMDGYKPTRTPGFVLPCGVVRKAAPAQPITTFPAGSTIGMKWTETIYHPGCFIVDFAPNDTGPSTVFQRLQIGPHNPGTQPSAYQVQLKLPSSACTNCILRVRQYMVGSNPCPPANLTDTDDNLYYSCANVVLSASNGSDAGTATDAAGSKDAAVDLPSSSGTGGAATGGTSGGAGGTGGNEGSGGGSGGAAAATGGASGSGGAATVSGTGGASTGSGVSESSNGCSVASSPGLGALSIAGIAVLLISKRRRRPSLSRR
ncbi:MAG TPA: SCE4755 family polysaccharide monooxygenase-like protein, partial [Polyangia bacterium]